MTDRAGRADRFAERALFALLAVKALLFALLVPPWLGNDEPNHFEYVMVMSGTADAATAQKAILDSLNRTDYWKRSEMPAPAPGTAEFERTELKMHSEAFVGTRSAMYYRIAALPLRIMDFQNAEGMLLASRMVSVALSILTLLFIYRAALVVFQGDGPASLLAVALAGLHPQFSYLSAVVNSDVLMYLLFSLTFYWMVLMVKDGDVSPERLLVLCGLMGLSLLAKKPGMVLAPVALGGLLFASRGAGKAFKAVLTLSTMLVAGVLLLEFLLPLEVIKLVDRIGISLGFFLPGREELASLSPMQWVRGFAIMFVTFWFTYGQMVFKQSAGFYVIYAAFSLLAFAGLVAAHFQNARGARDGTLSRQMLFSLFFVAVVVAMTVFTFFSPQWIERVSGRYLFYAVAPMALLASAGIRAYASSTRPAHFYGVCLMLVFNVIALFFYLVPLYG